MTSMADVDTQHLSLEEGAAREARPLPIARSVVGGVLMGLANLVPGVSGGTMILVVGLYDEFITSVADVTRLRLTRRNVTFLVIVGGAAATAIAALAGTLSRAVTLHQSAMFSLFLGLTLGGAPLLVRMLKGFTASSLIGVAVGLAAMIAIATTKEEPPDKEAIRAAVASGEFVIVPRYPRDVAAGALGMSAMVLPGISGAYMLLVLDRYETILASIAAAKDYVVSTGENGDPHVFLRVLIPTAIGAVVSLVLLSNLLKWLLHRHEKPTLGLLLGILCGAVVGIWPFDAASQAGDYTLGALLAVAGFSCTFLLSRLSA
jgi:putative membrane protein